MRRLHIEDEWAEALGKGLRPAGMDEQGGVPRRQEPNGRVDVAAWKRCAWEIEQLPTLLVAVRPQPQPLGGRAERRHGHAGPVRRVHERRRAEPGEVAAQEMLEADLLVDGGGPQPALGRCEQVSTSPLPGSGRRHPYEIDEWSSA